MDNSGNVQAVRRILAFKMNTGAKPLRPQGAEMIKIALVALFVLSMGTLGFAASGLPVDQTMLAAELN